MSHYFLDSSALIKRYLSEPGTNWILALTAPAAGNTILMAEIGSVEVVSGAARQQRLGRHNLKMVRDVRNLIDYDALHEYEVVRFTPEILARAEDLLLIHPLRAYDAVQLASALVSNTDLQANGLTPLTFVAADTRLLAAASAEKLTVDNPNNYL